MRGYKVFVSSNDHFTHRWTGPYHNPPLDWKIREGSILTEERLNPYLGNECGEGINFLRNKKDVKWLIKRSIVSADYIVVYAVKTLPDSHIIIPFKDNDEMSTDLLPSKVRTDKLRLVKRISLLDCRDHKNVKEVKKIRR